MLTAPDAAEHSYSTDSLTRTVGSPREDEVGGTERGLRVLRGPRDVVQLTVPADPTFRVPVDGDAARRVEAGLQAGVEVHGVVELAATVTRVVCRFPRRALDCIATLFINLLIYLFISNQILH